MEGQKAAQEMGLSAEEYRSILRLLSREPTLTELGMFAVMWSEHCGYKFSRPVLALFRQYREAQEKGALENAGVIPLDERLGVVFKVESHNHPSAVEPFQGAATGVGGILRDIFTMGARPIACLDSLRFGPLDEPRNRYLFEHVVGGISHYGNCVGVPTVAGETFFHPSYSGNPLVNAMAVGIVPLDRVAHASAAGIGNPVLYVGSSTGRDGIHGATFASVELGEKSEERRPNVQMGDPFMEKLLIESTLEALATGAVVGIQDMGAAGLTCSTSEMASKGGVGVEIDVRRVPLRDASMTPYEIMLSESQERMLCVVRKGQEERVSTIFRKWGLNAAVIGRVTDDGKVRILDGGATAAELPAAALTSECPTYHLEAEEPPEAARLKALSWRDYPEPVAGFGAEDALTYQTALLRLLDSPNIASKEWVTSQYDSSVQAQTAYLPGADAAILRVRGSTKGLAVKIDGNGRYCRLDPFVGAQIAVAEAARNVASVGAVPAGITDNLNFGSPEKPAGFWQFRRAVEGIASAAEAFQTPVVSGNVSFYNETAAGSILPTPTIGMVGILSNPDRCCGAAFRSDGEGHPILLLEAYSDSEGGMGGSEYMSWIHSFEGGSPPRLDLDGEKRLQRLLHGLVEAQLTASCHDVSDGGLAVCLSECATLGGIGAYILLRPALAQPTISALLFGEAQGRAIVTVSGERQIRVLEERALAAGVQAHWIGTVGGSRLRIAVGAVDVVDAAVETLTDVWRSAIPRRMKSASLPESQ